MEAVDKICCRNDSQMFTHVASSIWMSFCFGSGWSKVSRFPSDDRYHRQRKSQPCGESEWRTWRNPAAAFARELWERDQPTFFHFCLVLVYGNYQVKYYFLLYFSSYFFAHSCASTMSKKGTATKSISVIMMCFMCSVLDVSRWNSSKDSKHLRFIRASWGVPWEMQISVGRN